MLPVYPPPPHCNDRGLTELGGYLLRQMIKQHLIIEIDHMDVKTARQALVIIQANHYAGVISSHSWDSQLDHTDVYKLGGFIAPYPSSPTDGVAQWHADKAVSNPDLLFGYGYGSDMNGLAHQANPTYVHPIRYPFHSLIGNVRFGRERWGQRVFDINKDGVANYGMYADWLEELRILGGPPMINDMMGGAEAYLETWERAYGVPAIGCRPAALRALRLGTSSSMVLKKAGQPSSRPGRSFRYCGGKVRVMFNSKGRVARIARQRNGA